MKLMTSTLGIPSAATSPTPSTFTPLALHTLRRRRLRPPPPAAAAASASSASYPGRGSWNSCATFSTLASVLYAFIPRKS